MKNRQIVEEINTKDNSYSPSKIYKSSDSRIYKWTDSDNKKHFTNDYESIPLKYKKQIKK